MKLAVFSDSHGDWHSLRILMDEMGAVDAVCFLGDVARDAEWMSEQLERLVQKPAFYAVRGNNDLASLLPDELTFSMGGKTIYMTHGHLAQVRSGTDLLVERALRHGAHIALYGHTHRAYCAYERGVFVLNPGAAGNPYGAMRARASLIALEGDCITTKDLVL